MHDRIQLHREMATRMYEAQVVGYQHGRIEIHGGWTADGQVHEPYEMTLFSPKRGDWTIRMTRPDTMNPNAEFQMYWFGIPDFGIKWYEIFPHEDGWICRMRFEGTATDGELVVAHQVDFATVDDQGRVVRMEWYVDQPQWNKVWSKASGKTVEEVAAKVATLGGWDSFLAEINAAKRAREAAESPNNS
jgi:hypothetical protein